MLLSAGWLVMDASTIQIHHGFPLDPLDNRDKVDTFVLFGLLLRTMVIMAVMVVVVKVISTPDWTSLRLYAILLYTTVIIIVVMMILEQQGPVRGEIQEGNGDTFAWLCESGPF